MADWKLFRWEECDHAMALIRYDDLLLDAGGGIAVFGRTLGFQRKHHAFPDLARVGHGDDAADDRTLVQREERLVTGI